MNPLANLPTEPELFDFFLTCRRLEAAHPHRPKIGEGATPAEHYVHFGQDPFLAFPTSTISRVHRKPDGSIALMVRFLGLLGPQGALPLTTSDEAHDYFIHGDDSFARFLDLFNNRFVQLFFRAWANARPLTGRDRATEDRFEAYLGSFIGLGTPALRALDSVPDAVKIGYAGLIGAKVKSASRLRNLLTGLFGLRTEIEEFVGTRLVLDADQSSRIGLRYAVLGQDIVLGRGSYNIQDKIRIRLFATSLDEYRVLLPSGGSAQKLADIVFFFLGAEIDWDVELALPAREAEPIRLGRSGQLGWTSWMAPRETVPAETYRKDARFDLAKRFGKT